MNKDFWIKLEDENFEKKKEKVKIKEKILTYKTERKPLIEVKNLGQKYKTRKGEKVIFENLNFKIYENDKVALVGANGCGKTTIVEIISGFKNPSSGEVIQYFDDSVHEKNRIGVQFQDLSFPRNLTVKQILDFITNLDEKSIDVHEFKEMLYIFDLKLLLNTKITKLSGGQQQRLNVLLSLINKPKVLFLDEFSTGLDIAAKGSIKNFIIDYCKTHEIALVIISHDVEAMEQIVNRAIVINDKQIMLDASKKEIEEVFGSFSKMIDNYIN